ncbi:serine protease PepA, partial [mine drainage metagenome]
NTTLNYQQSAAAGTGIVLSSNGLILTNNHVIDGATTIHVTDLGNHQTYPATVVGYDATSDVAVLRLQGASGLTTATLASSPATVGQSVYAVGNADGLGGTPTVTAGHVTSLDQSITAGDPSTGTSESLSGLIETDATLIPGDSGGALTTATGRVVGMDTAASSTVALGSSAQGYA